MPRVAINRLLRRFERGLWLGLQSIIAFQNKGHCSFGSTGLQCISGHIGRATAALSYPATNLMKNTDIQAVVFDMDDTLIKTFDVKFRQHQHFALQRYGLVLADDEFRLHWGKPFHLFLEGLYGHVDQVDRALAEYVKLSHLFPVELQSDTLHVLDGLHGAGKKLGIVTATAREVVVRDLTPVSFPFERLHKLQTSDDTPVHKPDPKVFEPILKSLRDADVKGGIVYVGDALTDYYAARDAGLHFVGVTTGLITAEQFRDAGATHVVDNLGGVANLVLR